MFIFIIEWIPHVGLIKSFFQPKCKGQPYVRIGASLYFSLLHVHRSLENRNAVSTRWSRDFRIFFAFFNTPHSFFHIYCYIYERQMPTVCTSFTPLSHSYVFLYISGKHSVFLEGFLISECREDPVKELFDPSLRDSTAIPS